MVAEIVTAWYGWITFIVVVLLIILFAKWLFDQ